MRVNAIPQIDQGVMDIKNQSWEADNQNANGNVTRLKWKVNLTCCKCGSKGHLARECSHKGDVYAV